MPCKSISNKTAVGCHCYTTGNQTGGAACTTTATSWQRHLVRRAQSRGVFRNRARGGPTLVFRPIERRSWTFYWLSPISNVKFGLLRGGGPWPNGPPPPHAPDLNTKVIQVILLKWKYVSTCYFSSHHVFSFRHKIKYLKTIYCFESFSFHYKSSQVFLM